MGCKTSEKTMKKRHRKGLWSPDEDQRLKDYILYHGIGCWSSVPVNAGLQRSGKSCRLRWINYLRPGVKRGAFSSEEEEIILALHSTLGNKWSLISKHLSGRTDNEIKNYWHSYLKKRMPKPEGTERDIEPKFTNIPNKEENSLENSINSSSKVELESPGRGEEMLRVETGSCDFSKQQSRSLFPRLVFADWLTMDDTSLQNEQVHQQASLQDDFGYSFEKQKELVQVLAHSEGSSSSGEFSVEAGSDFEKGMMDLPFKFQDQSTSGSDQFMDLSAVHYEYLVL